MAHLDSSRNHLVRGLMSVVEVGFCGLCGVILTSCILDIFGLVVGASAHHLPSRLSARAPPAPPRGGLCLRIEFKKQSRCQEKKEDKREICRVLR